MAPIQEWSKAACLHESGQTFSPNHLMVHTSYSLTYHACNSPAYQRASMYLISCSQASDTLPLPRLTPLVSQNFREQQQLLVSARNSDVYFRQVLTPAFNISIVQHIWMHTLQIPMNKVFYRRPRGHPEMYETWYHHPLSCLYRCQLPHNHINTPPRNHRITLLSPCTGFLKQNKICWT